MPSNTTATYGYRKAKCCETCTHFKCRYCSVLLMQVNPSYVCNTYFGAAGRAARKTMCSVCVFGPNGDHTCSRGTSDRTGNMSCFSGRKMSRARRRAEKSR